MTTEFDVLIVGGRCAGSPLAALLARAGVRVGVIEKVAFPRDTLSTHIFQASAINFLHRLGVLDEVRATGAPLVTQVDLRQDDYRLIGSMPMRPGDRGMTMSVRRILLDPILAAEAERSGANVMMRTAVTGMCREGTRVSGVRVSGPDGDRELTARLVVGADGRNSTVATGVGARKYHTVPSERFAYSGFFEGAAPEPTPHIVFHRWDGRFVIATQADSGYYQVVVIPDDSELFREAFRADRERAFLAHAMACEPVARILGQGATRVGKLIGMKRWEGFLRESAGPGWALVGDAGHFKDPAPGQGMGDAFRQAEALAPAIVSGLGRSDAELDAAVAAWARWRDRDATPAHWMAADFGAGGRWPAVVPEMMRRLERRGRLDEVTNLIQHRSVQSQVFTPTRVAGATASLMVRSRRGERKEILREVGELVREDMRRRVAMVRPVYATGVDTEAIEESDPVGVPA
jgi:2-polyprenyl-6-methoxyphenol hydroxylase-like FAD-dependent oxidoreductase